MSGKDEKDYQEHIDQSKNQLELLKRDELLDYIFLNLKIISQIQESQKVRIIKLNGLDTLDVDTRLIHKYIRGRWGDSRTSTVNMIKKIIDLCYQVSDEILKEELETEHADSNKNHHHPFDCNDDNSRLFRSLVVEMEKALDGLENLKNTYNGDISITSAIEIMIGKMKLRIAKINAIFRISHLPGNIIID
jgi:hypothetical protein